MKKLTLPLALSALLPIPAFAGESKPVEIVITAKGQQSLVDLSSTAHIITQDDIERSQAKNLTEILDTVSGINITRNGGRGSQSDSFIRGANSRQTIVLVDGLRVGSATTGATNLGHIPIDIIERVEVVKGPLSGLYGADAMGGVIQIFTKKGGNGLGNVSIQAGSFGHSKASVGINQAAFSIHASHEENTGIDATQNTEGGNDDNDGFKENAISMATAFDINHATNFSIQAFFAENDIEFDNSFGPDNDRFTSNKINNISTNLTTRFAEKSSWSTHFGVSNNEATTPEFSSQFDTERVTLSSQGDFSFSNNTTAIVGVDYYNESVKTSASFSENERNNKGIFGQVQQQLGKLGIVANARYDDNSAYGDITNGSLAVNYALSHTTRLTASYGTAFRAPTFNELYFPGFGNENIQPEESESIEVSLRRDMGKTQWRISAYDTKITNLIESPAPAFVAVNTNEASLQGIELEISTVINQWLFSSSFDYLDATDESTGNALIRRPEQTLKLSIDRQFDKLFLGADLLAEKGRYDRGNVKLDSFERVDLKSAYHITPNFAVHAKIGNLFDKDYQLAQGFNTEGRTLSVSGKINF